MANYNDDSSKYFYDPAVQSRMADDMDKWNRELRAQKSSSGVIEDYLTEIRKSVYGSDVRDDLIWRLNHPKDRKNSPIYLGWKNNKVKWGQFFLAVFLLVGAVVVFFGGVILLPEFKYRDWILFGIFALMMLLSCVCFFTLPKSTIDHFNYGKALRMSNKIWWRGDAKRYLGWK